MHELPIAAVECSVHVLESVNADMSMLSCKNVKWSRLLVMTACALLCFPKSPKPKKERE